MTSRSLAGFFYVLSFIGPLPALLAADEKGGDGSAEARKLLIHAVEMSLGKELRESLQTLVTAGGRENIDLIIRLAAKVPPSGDGLYWDLVQGACSFKDKAALEFLGDVIVRLRSSGISRDLVFGLARNRSTATVFALSPLLRKGPPDLQLMAAEKIGAIPCPEAVDVLIETLKREETKASDLRDAVLGGLEDITGMTFGTMSLNWEGWWKQNREKAVLGPQARKENADKRVTGTAIDHLDKKREQAFVGLERIPKKSVVVLSAEFPQHDCNNGHIENALESMGVPHQIVKRPDFEKFDLKGVGAIFINCSQFHEFCICPNCKPAAKAGNRLYQCSGCSKHITFSGKLSSGSIAKLKNFVMAGGSLFCEDWTVKEVVERAFPEYVAAGKVLKKDEVDVVPARGRVTHPLLKGIFRPEKPPEPIRGIDDDDDDHDGAKKEDKKGAEKPSDGPTKVAPKEGDPLPPNDPELVKLRHQWVIDDESWALKILDANKVVVLLTSGKLQKDTEGQGVVALCFRPGGDAEAASIGKRGGPGLVLQVLSHFGKQESSDDEFTLQNLLLNFLLASNVARNLEEAARSNIGKKGAAGKSPAKAGGDAGKSSAKDAGDAADGKESDGTGKDSGTGGGAAGAEKAAAKGASPKGGAGKSGVEKGEGQNDGAAKAGSGERKTGAGGGG